MMKNIKVIAFDADDTLWANESHFQEVEAEFTSLLTDYLPAEEISKELFKTEMQNIESYGFGIKSFTLSMIETAIRISNKRVDIDIITRIINFGKKLLDMPVELLPDVKDVLERLSTKYILIIATKGDLLDQERKIVRSGLKKYFSHIGVMSNKNPSDYLALLAQVNTKPEEFLMIGNSVKSDILPVLDINGYAAHIPFHVTWEHEKADKSSENSCYISLEKLTDIFKYLD